MIGLSDGTQYETDLDLMAGKDLSQAYGMPSGASTEPRGAFKRLTPSDPSQDTFKQRWGDWGDDPLKSLIEQDIDKGEIVQPGTKTNTGTVISDAGPIFAGKDLDKRDIPVLPIIPSDRGLYPPTLVPSQDNPFLAPPGGMKGPRKPGERLGSNPFVAGQQFAHHEQSETIQNDQGEWVNVYGKKTPKAGQQLPDSKAYPTMEEAVSAAKERSNAEGRQEEWMKKNWDPETIQRYRDTRKKWEDMSSEELRNRAREDVEDNVLAFPMWRGDEYKKYWDEEMSKYRKEGSQYKMSPKQLREKGVKP